MGVGFGGVFRLFGVSGGLLVCLFLGFFLLITSLPFFFPLSPTGINFSFAKGITGALLFRGSTHFRVFSPKFVSEFDTRMLFTLFAIVW